MNIIKMLFGTAEQAEAQLDEERPVKLVPDGYNSWRVVYAD